MSKVFRLQNKVPEVYVEQSRDFQLFCRLYDSVFGGERYLIDSLRYASSTGECNERLLELLQTKLGYFSSTQLTAQELRLILQAFPYIVKHKGSTVAIHYVIALFRRLTYTGSSSILEYEITEDHELKITFDRAIPTDTFLHELLNYILPSGYIVTYDVKIDQGAKSSIHPVDKLFDVAFRTDDTLNTVSEPRTDATYQVTVDDEGTLNYDAFDNLSEILGTVGLSQVTTEEGPVILTGVEEDV